MNKKTLDLLHQQATQAFHHAYAPYSKFQVGAALLDSENKIYLGCNFENASYGGCICAERNAVGQMISGGGRQIQCVVIVTTVLEGCPPCGICRQTLSEFIKNPKKALIYMATPEKIVCSLPFSELLPFSFNSKTLFSKKSH